MGKEVKYDHEWQLIPNQGRNWASRDYLKYTITHKVLDQDENATSGGRRFRRRKMQSRIKHTNKNKGRFRRKTYKKK
jgi:hypothetical protein